MLRGLLYRRLFLAADVVLCVAIAWFSVYAFAASVTSPRLEAKTTGEPAGSEPNIDLDRGPGSRDQYAMITDSSMFGDAGKKTSDFEEPEKPEPKPDPGEEKKTSLPLSLFGTVTEGKDDPLAAAVIEVREGSPKLHTYYVGEEIVSRVILKEVRKKEVVLDNRRTMQYEYLRMDDTDMSVRLSSNQQQQSNRQQSPTNRTNRDIVEIDRRYFAQQLNQNYEQIAREVDVREEVDENGNVIGLSASNISDIQLAQDLGLQDGDVLTTVNNEQVDSVEKVFEIVNKYRNARSFRLGVIRNGRLQTISYRLK